MLLKHKVKLKCLLYLCRYFAFLIGSNIVTRESWKVGSIDCYSKEYQLP